MHHVTPSLRIAFFTVTTLAQKAVFAAVSVVAVGVVAAAVSVVSVVAVSVVAGGVAGVGVVAAGVVAAAVFAGVGVAVVVAAAVVQRRKNGEPVDWWKNATSGKSGFTSFRQGKFF